MKSLIVKVNRDFNDYYRDCSTVVFMMGFKKIQNLKYQ